MASDLLENGDTWLRDLPAFVVACMLHAALITSNPSSWWSSAAKPLEKTLAVEFVAAPPPSLTAALAPMPAGNGRLDETPHHGPGPLKPERIKKPKPHALIAKRAHPGLKPKPKRLKPVMTAAQKAEIARIKAEKARARAEAIAEAKRLKEEQLRRAREAAAALAAQKAAEAQARAERLAAEKAERERQRIERERQLAEARAEKARQLAEARAERARQKAEITQQLAEISSPDEALADGPNDAAAAAETGGIPHPGSPRGKGVEDGPIAHGDPAALNDAAEPVYETERAGSDSENAPATGGGFGPNGGGGAWSLEGPAGNRRLVRRVLPTSPDWVSQRGLELAVKIKFQVLNDGSIKAGAVIKKTSGFPEIDKLALEALRRWKFQAVNLKSGGPEVWGTVTFRFMMG